MTINNIRVGIPIIGSREWLGGIAYVELLAKAIAALKNSVRPQIFLVVRDHNLDDFDLYKHIIPSFEGIFFVGNELAKATATLTTRFVHCHSFDELHKHIDVYFPVNSDIYPHRCSASWIPDFQHKYLPEFFSAQEIAERNEKFERIAREARIIVFSSRSAQQDFRKFYPCSRAVTKVLSFFSYPQEDWYTADYVHIQKKYELPDRFILCCNQLWAHKNYERLFEAIALVCRGGQDVHLVCTGSMTDYRLAGYYEKINRLIQDLGITNAVHMLGVIPRHHQIQLIRRSLMVVQPSLFEGWSTVVEDCRALGKTILLSNLDVNIEQNPDYGIYFRRTDVEDLVLKTKEFLKDARPGPDLEREVMAKSKALDFANQYARQFCDIVSTTKELFVTL